LNKQLAIICVVAILLRGYDSVYGLDSPDVIIDHKLAELKPLPKTHYYWPSALDLSQKRIYELGRITHSLCISGSWGTQQQVDNYVYNYARINKTKPAIETVLGINFSPLSKVDKEFPSNYRGEQYLEGMEFFEKRLRLVESWIEQTSKKYMVNVKVGAVTLDVERYLARTGADSWN
jgi:hypothetical protein